MIEVLIIGAGPSGLCAAKTLRQVEPDTDLLVVEAGPSLGGVWSRERVYPTLKTNNRLGSIDFSDFPMATERFGVRPEDHVPGDVMNQYLSAYAETHGLLDNIVFGTRVVEVKRRNPGPGGREECWLVEVEQIGGEKPGPRTIECRKLVVATGVLNVPRLPDLTGMEDFGAPVVHSSNMGSQYSEIFIDTAGKDETTARKTLAVIGGSKSAYDAVYLAWKTGHDVEWIIRRSGRGPCWVPPAPTKMGPFKVIRETMVRTRVISMFSPWVFPDHSGMTGLRNWLQGTRIGQLVTKGLWKMMHKKATKECAFRTREELNVLEPEENPFWYGTASGINNYEHNLHDIISSGQIRVHRDDIARMSDHTIHLSHSGKALRVDGIIAATGYLAKPPITFAPASTPANLGVPTTTLDAAQQSYWASLDVAADAFIAARSPKLAAGPQGSAVANGKASIGPAYKLGSADNEIAYTPWRLYRGIAPPGPTAAGDRSLVFVGVFRNHANTMRLEVQCLWAAAYLFGRGLADPNLDGTPQGSKAVFEQTALFQRWAQLRAPYGHGRSFPDLVFDQIPYMDMLLHDLGLEMRRKRGWFRELFSSYGPVDYRGFVDEWLAKNPRLIRV